ncbi:unnamed protein product [Arctogadus glacialis]
MLALNHHTSGSELSHLDQSPHNWIRALTSGSEPSHLDQNPHIWIRALTSGSEPSHLDQSPHIWIRALTSGSEPSHLGTSYAETEAERNALKEHVYPKLRDFCRENYGIEFQVTATGCHVEVY